MKQLVELTITGQADLGSEAFKTEWYDFWIELQRLLLRFPTFEPVPPRLALEAKMTTAPLVRLAESSEE